ncbi:MAG: hypothetical protein DCC71_00040 [Proteobacteria bacterium]|nr:MAG: hypothetical protein DCC71_00040 [Pseudomonadota bacterium]
MVAGVARSARSSSATKRLIDAAPRPRAPAALHPDREPGAGVRRGVVVLARDCGRDAALREARVARRRHALGDAARFISS